MKSKANPFLRSALLAAAAFAFAGAANHAMAAVKTYQWNGNTNQSSRLDHHWELG